MTGGTNSNGGIFAGMAFAAGGGVGVGARRDLAKVFAAPHLVI